MIDNALWKLSCSFLVFCWGVALVGCTEPIAEANGDGQPAKTEPTEEETLLQIAAAYRDWGPVDGEPSWAPLLCRMPLPEDQHQVELKRSESDDEDTHGRKLYLLYAKDRAAYQAVADGQESPIGQVIVKQTWLPQEMTSDDLHSPDWESVLSELSDKGFPLSHQAEVEGEIKEIPIAPYIGASQRMYRPDELHSLFVMYKVDPEREGTDNGWIYATLTADGKTVTGSGRMQQCMECHVDAGDDRLFGVQSFRRRLKSD